jgi:hypothetical protein
MDLGSSLLQLFHGQFRGVFSGKEDDRHLPGILKDPGGHGNPALTV